MLVSCLLCLLSIGSNNTTRCVGGRGKKRKEREGGRERGVSVRASRSEVLNTGSSMGRRGGVADERFWAGELPPQLHVSLHHLELRAVSLLPRAPNVPCKTILQPLAPGLYLLSVMPST